MSRLTFANLVTFATTLYYNPTARVFTRGPPFSGSKRWNRKHKHVENCSALCCRREKGIMCDLASGAQSPFMESMQLLPQVASNPVPVARPTEMKETHTVICPCQKTSACVSPLSL